MATPTYKKYVHLDDGTNAEALVPIITSETLVTSTDSKLAYIVLSNGLKARCIVPLDSDGNVENGNAVVDEADTTGSDWAWVVLDDGTWAEAVVCIDEDGIVL